LLNNFRIAAAKLTSGAAAIPKSTIMQASGYSGLNFRDLVDDVGIKAASIYCYFSAKADLAAGVVKCNWVDSAVAFGL
jgi:hypothetical protein